MTETKRRILIVDDDADTRSVVSDTLEVMDLTTIEADSGKAALKLLSEEELPDVVVLDVMMPGIGGIEILQRMKAQNLQIPVILLTGYGSTEQGLEGMREGAFDYLMKPCDLNILISKIQEAVQNL